MSEPDDTASHPGYRDDDTAPLDVMAFVALFDDAYPPPGHDATQTGHLPHGMRDTLGDMTDIQAIRPRA